MVGIFLLVFFLLVFFLFMIFMIFMIFISILFLSLILIKSIYCSTYRTDIILQSTIIFQEYIRHGEHDTTSMEGMWTLEIDNFFFSKAFQANRTFLFSLSFFSFSRRDFANTDSCSSFQTLSFKTTQKIYREKAK